MGRNSFFQFKRFLITQEKAAMKVGIDGVLLGAWSDLENATRILDIGTGTGLLALMAAQRSDAIIEAVELDVETASEALFNFKNSEWHSRIILTVGPFQAFESSLSFDHIISNPPFFDHSPKPVNLKRAQARHTDSLSLDDLLKKSASLLSPDGKISLILPADKEECLRILAWEIGLYVNRLSRVAADENRNPHRLLVELSANPVSSEGAEIYIRRPGSSDYTSQYRELTKDFYLAF